jgi:DNA mismatch repair ATPase MutS
MFHMSFEERKAKGECHSLDLVDSLLRYATLTDGSAEITFTYHMIRGIAHRSFGVWVAKLAGLPSNVLRIASEKSEAMRRRAHAAMVRRAIRANGDEDPTRTLVRMKALLAT